ncbi:hypothetical protein IG193_02240 [Infirmifilum lucidum]|uniref:Polysaccharide deacetylase n=1 Tax=Infirmifilum lucidum TaxID=2776706 RepID=A0A7L9FKH0_9CREN|nr:hypothetical protein [Infirmifilum lucidum]QOJ79305.1 hypothetical protein IG193_02240 [Infirmifilum lucidum]
MIVVLTHDVDYSRRGPGLDHILRRRERFEEWVVERVLREGFNPYFGVPRVVEVEEGFGVRSTFFFRAFYDDGETVEGYAGVIRDLLGRGWSVGLHYNDPGRVGEEKAFMEGVLGFRVEGTRGHFLRVADFSVLRELGVKFDSSVVYSRGGCDARNAGFFDAGGVVEFPVTFMDAYMFTYDGMSEERVTSFIVSCVEKLREGGVKLATILWHDSSVYMRGGRVYPEVLRALSRFELLDMATAYRMVAGNEL